MYSNNARCFPFSLSLSLSFVHWLVLLRNAAHSLATNISSIVCVVVFQASYVLLVGTFPFNSLLAALFCCIGSAVLTCTSPLLLPLSLFSFCLRVLCARSDVHSFQSMSSLSVSLCLTLFASLRVYIHSVLPHADRSIEH